MHRTTGKSLACLFMKKFTVEWTSDILSKSFCPYVFSLTALNPLFWVLLSLFHLGSSKASCWVNPDKHRREHKKLLSFLSFHFSLPLRSMWGCTSEIKIASRSINDTYQQQCKKHSPLVLILHSERSLALWKQPTRLTQHFNSSNTF